MLKTGAIFAAQGNLPLNQFAGDVTFLKNGVIYDSSQHRATPRRTRTANARAYREHAETDVRGSQRRRISPREGAHGTHPRGICRFSGSFKKDFIVTFLGSDRCFLHAQGRHCHLRVPRDCNARAAAFPLYTLTRICYMEYTQRVESVFEIIAEPNRRAILSLLVSSQQSVGEIERQLRMSQPAVSKHLRVLRDAGFVESTVDAQRRLYRLKPEPLQELHAWLAQFRRFWSAHLDALERHLDRMGHTRPGQSTATKKNKIRRSGPNRERDKGETK